MTYLLDANVVSYFLTARREDDLATAASTVACAIADEVRQELLDDRLQRARIERWLPASHLRVLSIAIGSEADTVLSHLGLGLVTTRGRGERASIALAAADPDLVFTSMDKGSMWIALRELWAPGERLIGLAVFLRRLVDAGALPGEAADDVMGQSNQIVPSWWADWRSSPA